MRSASFSGGNCFSNPSGMSDFFEAFSSSISSRRTWCDLPSASTSSTAFLLSDASRPLSVRPSAVASEYWTKFPSTERLGSRMFVRSSAFGCAAMPVRSGPTLPPSPEWVWHLAHCSLKTSLPRAGSPPARTSGPRASITFCRSASGRPPPREISDFALDAIDESGCVARACFWSSESSSRRTEPSSTAARKALVHSARPSSALTASDRTAGVSDPSDPTIAAPASGASLREIAVTIPVDNAGGVRGEIKARRSRAVAASRERNSTSCRAASARAASGLDSSRAVASRPVAISTECFANASEPQRLPSVASWPRASGESLGSRAIRAASAFGLSLTTLSFGQPRKMPPMMALAGPGSAWPRRGNRWLKSLQFGGSSKQLVPGPSRA